MQPEKPNPSEATTSDGKPLKLVTLENLKYFWDPESVISSENKNNKEEDE